MEEIAPGHSERRHIAVAAPTWFIARAVAMRELGCSSGELVELGVEATDVTPHVTVTWAGSAASSHNTLRLVETRNAR